MIFLSFFHLKECVTGYYFENCWMYFTKTVQGLIQWPSKHRGEERRLKINFKMINSFFKMTGEMCVNDCTVMVSNTCGEMLSIFST